MRRPIRRPIIAGNWKMNTDRDSAAALARRLALGLRKIGDRDVLVIPPFPFIEAVVRAVESSPILVGAQDCRAQASGAFTGDISVSMIKSVGAAFCLVGHSERRRHHGEDSALCAEKIGALLSQGLTPIYCVGESLDTREAGGALDLVETQLRQGLAGLSPQEGERMVMAYEPVWAIGTGRVATPEQAQEMHRHIRAVLAEIFGRETASRIRLQYGGSVKTDNVDQLMACPDIDGALVGGAALVAESFTRIVRFQP